MSDYAKAKPDLRPSYFIIDPYRQNFYDPYLFASS